MKQIAFLFAYVVLFLCSCGSNTTKSEITAEMAYEGVSNYCHSTYDWSVAKDNPDIMLDCSAIAKGYGVDVIARLLDKKGIKNYMVNIGGEVVMNHTIVVMCSICALAALVSR